MIFSRRDKHIFLVGLGKHAAAHLDAISAVYPKAKIGAYSHEVTTGRSKLPEKLEMFETLETGLQAIRPQIVIVITPPGDRLRTIETILNHASPVSLLVEKPLAVTLEASRRIVDICSRSGTGLTVGYQSPLLPEYAAMLKWVRKNRIGKLRSAEITCFGPLFNQGAHQLDLLTHMIGPPAEGEWAEGAYYHDLDAIRAIRELPDEYEIDKDHLGAPRFTGRLHSAQGQTVTIECGLLTPIYRQERGLWLQRYLRVNGSHGHVETLIASHATITRSNGMKKTVRSGTRHWETAMNRLYRRLLSRRKADNPRHILAVSSRLEALHQAGLNTIPVNVETS